MEKGRPSKTLGLRHVALTVTHFEACQHFYVNVLGMNIEWQPDPDNLYLTMGGQDNLALHRASSDFEAAAGQRLDHIGFILERENLVDDWYDYLKANNVTLNTEVKTHRDGARSFYCSDPDGNHLQMIYHPPIVTQSKGVK